MVQVFDYDLRAWYRRKKIIFKFLYYRLHDDAKFEHFEHLELDMEWLIPLAICIVDEERFPCPILAVAQISSLFHALCTLHQFARCI